MLSCEAIAMTFRFERKAPDQIAKSLVCPGVRLSDDVREALFDRYRISVFHCELHQLSSLDSNCSDRFLFSYETFCTDFTYRDLWRIAREGSKVVIAYLNVKDGVVKPQPKITSAADYGLEKFHPGLMSYFPYDEGIIRKDLAKHFRR